MPETCEQATFSGMDALVFPYSYDVSVTDALRLRFTAHRCLNDAVIRNVGSLLNNGKYPHKIYCETDRWRVDSNSPIREIDIENLRSAGYLLTPSI